MTSEDSSYLYGSYSSLESSPNEWNYFDLNDIKACHEKVPCTFETQVRNLGFLDHGSDTEHLETGTKMELPYWLAKELCAKQRRIVSVDLPKVYREAYRQILEADAMAVDLNKLERYFYSFGGKLLDFDYDDNPRIAESLMMTYMNRMKSLMDLSLSRLDSHQESQTFLPKLDHEERSIFDLSQNSLRRFEHWKQGTASKLVTSNTVINQRKRKRTEDK
ncbi:DNA replication complex GINS protein PSF3-like [Xenia sp. Carnegie-2017]|uniref:DNA replication complex GINS protein PSF3-like n=1 Tax=Xenia sp. Carnegie-2017 TaxID=2897299 RepID=UPI001F04C846|nr:DNA replication complex GINS protein PSF3-like [Xenia sp. Carnegie-2017]